MTTTITAATALSQNGFTTDDLATSDVELWIDDAIITTSTLLNYSISKLDAGTVTLADDLAAPVKVLITIMLREAKKTSKANSSSTSNSTGTSSSIGVGSINVSESSSVSASINAMSSLNNQANTPLVDLYWRLIDALKIKYASSSFRRRFNIGCDTDYGT